MILEVAHQIQKFINSREANITKITKIKLRVRTLEKFRKMTFLGRLLITKIYFTEKSKPKKTQHACKLRKFTFTVFITKIS